MGRETVSRLPRPCLGWRGDPCGAPAVGGRCPRHQAAMERERRPTSTARGYDPAYRRERAELLAPVDGRRVECEIRLPGCTRWADTADHVVPVSRGGRRGPLRPGCRHCNSARGDRPL